MGDVFFEVLMGDRFFEGPATGICGVLDSPATGDGGFLMGNEALAEGDKDGTSGHS